MNRRKFLQSSIVATLAGRAFAAPATPRFGHRQANIVSEPGPAVFDLAKKIPGLSGVELQVQFKGTTLWDKETLLSYKRAAEASSLTIPSLAGVWPPRTNLWSPDAEDILRRAIDCAHELKAGTILVVCLEANCPKMDQEQSYGPVVALLQKVSSAARDAGVTIGMETSLSTADDRKLVDLVNRPNIGLYYDLDNVERYHPGDAVPGITTLGTARIRQVHLKNEDRLLEQPGRVNWAAAVKGLAKVDYQGWFVFETSHSGPEQCMEATGKNIEFVKRNLGA
jgi:sugar phosphate isomerase/epimerase